MPGDSVSASPMNWRPAGILKHSPSLQTSDSDVPWASMLTCMSLPRAHASAPGSVISAS